MQEAQDCHLLNGVFASNPTLASRQGAITGHEVPTNCTPILDNPTGVGSFSRTWLDPDNAAGCLGEVALTGPAPSWIYDAESNPRGTRCTIPDYMKSIFGRRPRSVWTPQEVAAGRGFANRPFDNVGVQYGLEAFQSGMLSTAEFIDVNSAVGGLDIDWNWQPHRSRADGAALTTAYRAGLVVQPKQMARVPIIDLRGAANVEIHTDINSYIMRARLDAVNGSHDNQAIWSAPSVQLNVPPAVSAAAFDTMDRWLSAIEEDHRRVPLSRKVVENKPSTAVDSCWVNDRQVTDDALCRIVTPYFGTTRIAAGGPLEDDVLKCRLRDPQRADYNSTFTDTQWAELLRVFPDGVCDYTRPGLARRPSVPWMTFQGGPGGSPLGRAPRSRSLS